MILEREYRIECEDCHPIGAAHRPLLIREGCESCAEATAAAHRELGHRVTVHPPRSESKDTQRLLRKTGLR